MDNSPAIYKRRLNLPWLFEMAWRDSRRTRSRLMLFISSIIFGIAALVAIYTFGYNLRHDIDNQAATLIGADLSVTANKPVDKATRSLLDSISADRSEESNFGSMVYFPKGENTRLVMVRALQGNYPYYGTLETTPVQAAADFKTGQFALVDKILMQQFNAHTGDSIKVGEVTFLIKGVLNQAPGETGIAAGVAPIVYIPLQYLEKTGLSKKGSRIGYNFYFKLDKKTNVAALTKKLDDRLEKAGLSYDTIESRKEKTGRSFDDLARFLSLVGFIALLLGCVGVASAIHIYIREKIASIAIMRCMGVKASEAFLIYLIQILGIGLLGSIIGSALGSFIQYFLPVVFKDFLPLEISTGISWLAIWQGIVLGVIISILFALLPLISIRNISPLNTLRMSYEDVNTGRDPFRWLVYILIIGFIMAFSYLQLDSWKASVFFTIGIMLAFCLLIAVAWLIMRFVRLIIRGNWSYLVRQGFANLYRPNNQTIILMVSIGLSTSFICLLFFVQSMLIKQVTLATSGNQANLVVYDIQTSQAEPIAALARKQKLRIVQQIPVVTVRIESIKGKTASDYKKDSTLKRERWVFGNELRVTYRDSLTHDEKVTDGEFTGKVTSQTDVPISVDERYARQRLHVKVGDHLTFNVQGTTVSTIVGSLRKSIGRTPANFQIIFPAGVLEQAPQFRVLLAHTPPGDVSAKFQQALVKAFPNVSVIDLKLVLTVLDDIIDKISYVIRFMGGFSMITGLVVLIASVRISKYQRIRESVLLRTIGASRRQIMTINALEYVFLGSLSALTGIFIALTGSWLLAKYNFNIPFHVSALPAIAVFVIISVLTVVIGLLNSSGILNKPPLEILRSNA